MTVSFVLLPPDALRALLDRDLDAASQAAGVELPSVFLDDAWLWQIRLDQIGENPSSAPWLVRATIDESGRVVGRAGFHGPPDERGMVEIGYEVLPEWRRRGLGTATALALIEEAASHGGVHVVRASISPDNDPSLAIARKLGFAQVGEQIDEIDGLELVFERPVDESKRRV